MCQAGKVSFFFFQAVPLFPKTPFFTFTREMINANPVGGALRGFDPYSYMTFDAPESPKRPKGCRSHFQVFSRLLSQLNAAAECQHCISSSKRCNFRCIFIHSSFISTIQSM